MMRCAAGAKAADAPRSRGRNDFADGEFACPLQSEVWIEMHQMLGTSSVLAVNALENIAVDNRANTFVFPEKVSLRLR
jgi:hypothetical protein